VLPDLLRQKFQLWFLQSADDDIQISLGIPGSYPDTFARLILGRFALGLIGVRDAHGDRLPAGCGVEKLRYPLVAFRQQPAALEGPALGGEVGDRQFTI
jgi:hypothetical protein